ncbi:IQ and ubiquitin-like domain-containing protein [Angomonas deanei]|nr:IQ and ubiquitin-like domain-containing protein [Angomonas deanei]EPY43388.1 IQ and ubiquitin-like domain-containing protein [Angomonas deanei]|eukprot:EPY29760.1 IQ and ubiquitin-like domain-containing protein [Angomonas deanei]
MRFRVRLTVPVYAKEQDGNTSGAWSLIAKDLFETVATFLKVHPESFHLYKNSTERIRFMSILFIDRDVSTESAEAVTSEPLWVTLVFPPPTVSGKTEFAFDRRPEEEEDALPPQDLEEVDSLTMEEMFSRVPAHLAQVGPDEQLVKCIRVRTEKPYIHPNTLVEARLKHGLTYDQVIQSINHAAADDAESAIVAIIRSIAPGGKAFLGGYRDKNDHSRQFLHASTQLFMKNLNYSPFGDRRNAPQDICSRQTQTYGTSRSCQTLREYSSQTPRTDLLLDDTESVTVRARPYFTAEMLRELRTAKAIILQKMYRQWKARGIRRSLEEAEMEKQRRAAARQRAEEAGKMDAAQREQLRLSEPRTVKDFEALKEQIIKWREEESAAIRGNSSLSEEEKRLAQLALTKQELKLLQEVESRRRLTLLDRNDRKFDRTMDAMSSARNWGTVKVETQETQRAGELRDLYRALSDRTLVQNARLDVLLHVKWTVKEFENSLTQELTQLIDREADLLQRGRREASLDGLRTRIQNLFKQFIEDPEYNPMMAQYTKTATGRAKVRQMWEKSEGGGMTSSTRGGSTYLKSGNSTKRN